jgi:hypothetical protein
MARAVLRKKGLKRIGYWLPRLFIVGLIIIFGTYALAEAGVTEAVTLSLGALYCMELFH